MKRAPRLDNNHAAVMQALRSAGILVRSTAAMGQGFPDLLCAFRGVLVLLEVKDGTLPPSARALTSQEAGFLATWPKVYVVTSGPEAVRVVVEAARPSTDLLELAWGVIANVSGGDWEKQTEEWQGAAHRWGVEAGYRSEAARPSSAEGART